MTNKGGANPKYLDLETETKKQVNFRLPIDIIEKLQTIGKFTNKTNTEIVTELLSDYLSNKILTNNQNIEKEALKESIPEFSRFNIVERDLRDVAWFLFR